MLDTKGPEIRTGFLKDHQPVELQKDQILEISKLNLFQQLITHILEIIKRLPVHMNI